jgi:hypothetical protein
VDEWINFGWFTSFGIWVGYLSLVYLSVKAPLFDANGEVYGLCGVSTDISNRVRILAAQRRAIRACGTTISIASIPPLFGMSSR